MNYFKKIFDNKKMDSGLFGAWTSDQFDESTKQSIGNVALTFTSNGKLIYKIKNGHKIQIINMTFWTEGENIITNQPSKPRKEKTRYSIDMGN